MMISTDDKRDAGFRLPVRVLHWLMAVGIFAMLFIGVGMVASVSERHSWLVAIHKPLGALLLLLVCLRLAFRVIYGAPALPSDLPVWQQLAARGSHILLYLLMFAMPLVGWAMVSASGTPVTLIGAWSLPGMVPESAGLFAILRGAHRYLAYLLFATVLLHLAAALFHGLIRRDGVLRTMVSGRGRA